MGVRAEPVARPFFCMGPDFHPPPKVEYGLEKAFALLAALENTQEILVQSDYLSVLAQVEYEVQSLTRKLGLEPGGTNGH
jgi:hypothetical protein